MAADIVPKINNTQIDHSASNTASEMALQREKIQDQHPSLSEIFENEGKSFEELQEIILIAENSAEMKKFLEEFRQVTEMAESDQGTGNIPVTESDQRLGNSQATKKREAKGKSEAAGNGQVPQKGQVAKHGQITNLNVLINSLGRFAYRSWITGHPVIANQDEFSVFVKEILLRTKSKFGVKKLGECFDFSDDLGGGLLSFSFQNELFDLLYFMLSLFSGVELSKKIQQEFIRHILCMRDLKKSKKLLDHFLSSFNVDLNVTVDGYGCLTSRFISYLPNPEMLAYLVSKGLNLGFVDKKGDTALHYAAKVGDGEFAQKLVELGIDVNVVNNAGFTAFDLCSSNLPRTSELLKPQTIRKPKFPISYVPDLVTRAKQKERERRTLPEFNKTEVQFPAVYDQLGKIIETPVLEFIVNSEEERKKLKEQYPDWDHYDERNKAHGRVFQVAVFKGLDASMVRRVNHHNGAVIRYQKRRKNYDGFEKWLLDEDISFSSLEAVEPERIKIAEEDCADKNLLFRDGLGIGTLSNVIIYSESGIPEIYQEQLKELKNLVENMEPSLGKFWTETLAQIGTPAVQNRYFKTFEEAQEFVNNTQDAVCLMSHAHPCYVNLLTVQKPLLPDHQQQMAEQLKMEPFLYKTELCYEFVKRRMEKIDQYLGEVEARLQKKQLSPFITVNVGNHQLKFRNLMHENDYCFIVNTLKVNYGTLSQLKNGNYEFLKREKNPFISASMVTPTTRGFAGGDHYKKTMFPIMQTLIVPPQMIHYAAPNDMHVPFACRAIDKLLCLNDLDRIRTRITFKLSSIQQQVQTKKLKAASASSEVMDYYPPHFSLVLREAEREEMTKFADLEFESQGNNFGALPLLTPEALIARQAKKPKEKNSYTEMIIGTTKKPAFPRKLKEPKETNQKEQEAFKEPKETKQKEELACGKLLLVDACLLVEFIQNLDKESKELTETERANREKSLQFLEDLSKETNGQFELALINTSPDGYLDKIPALNRYHTVAMEVSACHEQYEKTVVPYFQLKQRFLREGKLRLNEDAFSPAVKMRNQHNPAYQKFCELHPKLQSIGQRMDTLNKELTKLSELIEVPERNREVPSGGLS